jgi:ABC-type multidrug transport system ATPase subunit/CRP-like cAMP-binding protein
MTTPAADRSVLRKVPTFSACSDDEIDILESSLSVVDVPAGEAIFREGEDGDSMYIIADGQVRIASDVASEKVVFAHLGPGDFFGEMALLSGAPRSAAAIAGTRARLWRIGRQEMERIRANHPGIDSEITRILGQRLQKGNVHRYQNEAVTHVTLTPERREITIGRLETSDVVVDDPQASALHARIIATDGVWKIVDEGSDSGTYVNRRRVESATLAEGDEILVGTTKVFIVGTAVKSFTGGGGFRIDARGLGKVVGGGKRILDDVNLSIYPGEFVAVVGGSGAGKSTFLHALSGFAPATEGRVEYNGLDLYGNQAMFRNALGYVPQDDIVHPELTVERTLYYAAKLRLPRDLGESEISERIDEVLTAVGLAQNRKTAVGRLSGGQRKRVSVALELLQSPKVLFLDEPTSGLDPALEGRMMALFRSLSEQGTTVVTTTHSTQNLRMCDKIAWFAPGGHLLFFGSPAEAIHHFGVQDFGDVYSLLNDEEGRTLWQRAFEDSPAYRVNVQERAAPEMPRGEGEVDAATPRTGFWRQLNWLTRRYAEVMVRDTLNFGLLLFQAPAIALSLIFLFDADTFAASAEEGGDALRGLMAFHIITASAIFLGASNAAREITKEAGIYARERLVNVAVVPYIFSKVLVLASLCVFQAVTLVGLFMLWVDLPGGDWGIFPGLLAAIFLVELAGLAMGLLVSASVGNSDRAMAVVPVLLIPQLIFAGALVPLEGMLLPAKILSNLMISKWALQLSARLANLDGLFRQQFPESFAGPYESGLDVEAWLPWTVLGAMTALMLVAAAIVQRMKDVR